MFRNLIELLIWIVLIQFVSFLSGGLTESQIPGWYSELNKSALTPPDIVFPIVWGILYTMVALAGWWLWKNRHEVKAKKSLRWFFGLLLLNWLWTPVFFYFHLIGPGFLLLIANSLVSLYVIMLSYRRYQLTAILLIPYFLWLCFATYLNGVICYLN